MRLVRLPSFKIQIGEPLPWSLRDKTGRLLLSHSLCVETKDQLDAMLVHGIYIDVAEAQARYRQLQKQEAPSKPEPLIASTLKTPNSLLERWIRTTDDFRQLTRRLPTTPPAASEIHDFAIYLIELTNRQPDIAVYHMVRQEYAHIYYYGYSHSIHVAILCLLIARRLSWPSLKIMSLVKAALTMNLPILQLQGVLAQQDSPPPGQPDAAGSQPSASRG